MGDISEMRGLIVTMSFLGCLIFLIAIFPPQFYAVEYEGREIEVPEYFEGLDIQHYAETWIYRMNETDGFEFQDYWYIVDVDIGNHDFDFWYAQANKTELKCLLRHHWAEWIILIHHHDLEWINREGKNRGENLEVIELNEDYQNQQASYKVECNHFYARAYFGYNETIYSNVTHAWNQHDLHIFIGIDFDQTTTSYNAWALIGMLLFWQLPDMHWVVNILISIPFWACIAYLSYILILRTIGAIFGGGA